ncbi:sensor histidine kinase [Candidatus Gracilibacteria bacterium]|nr:sensor histidine kinase [Candidatus Gracilibacteria bacterium]
MSAEPTTLLHAAHTIVAEQQVQLRALIDTAQQRISQLEQDLRQVERWLDEVVVQHRFAAERKLPTARQLGEREAELRSSHETLLREYNELRRAQKQLDQLVRQIDMSSATLTGQVDGEPADPWMQALRSQIITGREEERTRLAREVHDGPAQVLANSLMGLERCRTLLESQRFEHLASLLDRMRDASSEGLQEVRRFIADLRPGKLDEQGLAGAIQEYIRRYRDAVNDKVTLDADLLPRLNADAEIVLYRIVQESLQNAHKHARGAAVHVVLQQRQDRLVLHVRDEGPGFEPRRVARKAGRDSWGLTSMRERAELIGARFVVASSPGHGTEVRVELPL